MKYEFNEYRPSASDEELIEDLKRVASAYPPPLSSTKYQGAGKYNISTISRRFGSWTHALELAGVTADTTNRQHSTEELFSNIERVWVTKGKQPTRSDMNDKSLFSTPQAIYKWQRGTALPTVDNLVVLAAIFGVKIDDILIFQDCGVIQISA